MFLKRNKIDLMILNWFPGLKKVVLLGEDAPMRQGPQRSAPLKLPLFLSPFIEMLSFSIRLLIWRKLPPRLLRVLFSFRTISRIIIKICVLHLSYPSSSPSRVGSSIHQSDILSFHKNLQSFSEPSPGSVLVSYYLDQGV